MKMPRCGRHHVERHHRRQHLASGQSLAQHRHVADTVLQADDDGLGRRVPRDDVGHVGGIGALELRAGERFLLQAAGGGGYGDPQKRDPALLKRDIAEGYISAEAAARDYGDK